jgi:hypothetical protein
MYDSLKGQTFGMQTDEWLKGPANEDKDEDAEFAGRQAGERDAAAALTFKTEKEDYTRYKWTKVPFGPTLIYLANQLTIKSSATTRTLSTRDNIFHHSPKAQYSRNTYLFFWGVLLFGNIDESRSWLAT